jgi:hypothetical protein
VYLCLPVIHALMTSASLSVTFSGIRNSFGLTYSRHGWLRSEHPF